MASKDRLAEAMAGDKSMPIAVVGVSCRFPGDATNPQNFWNMITQGRDAWSPIPKERFNADAWWHPNGERQGSIPLKGMHFIKEDLALFDAPFFSITSKEAAGMDPQQRLMLEVAYEGLENAGIPMENLVGSDTGVFVGNFTKDYEQFAYKDVDNMSIYSSTGTGTAMLSNRISWFYDLRGPSFTLDTACSSSLVALHLACQSIRTGESKIAIAGGSGLDLTPDIMVSMTALNFLSPDGRSHSFDHRANGYARGEGLATIILKPLEDAIKAGDTIRGVIRGSGVNQDGHTPGITVPNSNAQAALIKSVYESAGLGFARTAYFEAHGTGTPTGDPLELGSIGKTFGLTRDADQPLLVGSVKPNIGHLEGCAGIAGFLKALLAVENGVIPKNLLFEKGNPRILFDEWKIKVPTETMPWPVAGLRRASVNSFGYGGTNAHVIVDDAANYLLERDLKANHFTAISSGVSTPSTDSGLGSEMSSDEENYFATNIGLQPKLLVWSSHESKVMEKKAQAQSQYAQDQLEKYKDGNLPNARIMSDLAYTLGTRRSVLPWKTFFVASSTKELCADLEKNLPKAIRSSLVPRLGFVFTGQGAQWYAMGRELLKQPLFVASVKTADAYLSDAEGCPWSALQELTRPEKDSAINSPVYSQPLCTILQVGIIDLYKSWGIEPAGVVGHSSGEIGAAYAAGALSRTDAWKIAYHRGRLSGDVKHLAPDLQGAMMAVGLSEADASERLSKIVDGVANVAAINSPSNVTVSGDLTAINELEAVLKREGIFARKLKVENAYHSHHMQVIADQYLDILMDIKPVDITGDVRMVSSVTGQQIKGSDLGADYWVRNMVSPVRFSEAVQGLVTPATTSKRRRNAGPKIDITFEIGPHAALQGPLKQILAVKDGSAPSIPYISALYRGKDAVVTCMEAAGKLWIHGCPVNLAKLNYSENTGTPKVLTDLPIYPWNHSTRHWHESSLSVAHRFRKHPRKELLGVQTADSSHLDLRWRNFIRQSENPWVQDHKIQNTTIYPAAGMLVMAMEAAQQIADDSKPVEGYELRDVLVGKALIVPSDEQGIEVVLHVRPHRIGTRAETATWYEFTIHSHPDAETWLEHCSGLFLISYASPPNVVEKGFEKVAQKARYQAQLEKASQACRGDIVPRQFYESLDLVGMEYGPLFRNITSIKSGDQLSCTTIEIPDTRSSMPYKFEYPFLIHPATLDNIIQTLFTARAGKDDNIKEAMVPTVIEYIYVAADMPREPGSKIYGTTTSRKQGFRETVGSMIMFDDSYKTPQVVIQGLRCTGLNNQTGGQANVGSSGIRKVCAELHWMEDLDMISKADAQDLILSKALDQDQPELPDLSKTETAALIYIKRSLGELSNKDVEGLTPHMKLFYDELSSQYATAMMLSPDKERSEFDFRPDAEDEFLKESAAASIEGKVTSRIGQNLTKILKKEIDPLPLLREDAGLYEYFRGSANLQILANQLAEWLQRISHKSPTLNILEIGAGAGQTTCTLLSSMVAEGSSQIRFSQYTFTDGNDTFIAQAQENLKDWGQYVKYAKLDIERDPVTQGFSEGAYDIVVATNVLHATHSIHESIANAKKLLKPGGRLVIIEVTHMLVQTSITFGTLDSWWFGEDDGRKGGPTMNESRWDDALQQGGLSGIDLALRDVQKSEDHIISAMISTVPRTKSTPVTREVMLVMHSKTSPGVQSLAEDLTSKFDSMGVPCTVGIFQDEQLYLGGKTCIALLELEDPLLETWSKKDYETFKRVCKATQGLLWVTRGGQMNISKPPSAIVTGLLRSLRSEEPSLCLYTLDLNGSTDIQATTTSESVLKVYERVFMSSSRCEETEYAEANARLFIPRMYEQRDMNELLAQQTNNTIAKMAPFKQSGRPLRLQVRVPGMLDSLQFHDDPEPFLPMSPDDVEIEVKATGLNHVDIMISMGQIPEDTMGMDAAGIVTRIGSGVKGIHPGERVVTFLVGAYRTLVRNPECLIAKIPDEMSFEIAASLPCTHMTAYQALIEIGKLKKDETVLIHAAAGGVGQAAIQVAQHIGAEVFVSCGYEGKKKLLMKTWGLPEDHIFYSRDLSFVKGINRMTDGRGIDVILHSLPGEALRQTWQCIAPFGRMIDVSMKDCLGNTGLDMAPFLRNATYNMTSLMHMWRNDKQMCGRLLQNTMDLVRQGVLREVKPIKVYSYSAIETALRHMQSGRHYGKMVFKVNDNDVVPVIPREPHELKLSPDATYVLIGGTGGIGRSTAQFLLDNGARNVALLSRSGNKTEATRTAVQKLCDGCEGGANVKAFACDITSAAALRRTLEQMAEEMPKIKGCIQGAMVLKDMLFENMNYEDFVMAASPKIQGSWNLHELLPKDMDFFVELSSSTGVVGNQGQANYAAGNTYEDALAHYRRAQGLPAVALDLGMIRGVGVVEENPELIAIIRSAGFMDIWEEELHSVLACAMTGYSKGENRMPAQLVLGVGNGDFLQQEKIDSPFWSSDAKFTLQVRANEASTVAEGDDPNAILRSQIVAATSLSEATNAITLGIVNKLAKSLMILAEDIDVAKPLHSYGVDSLVAVEVRTWTFRVIGADVSVFDILSSQPITQLAGMAARKSKLLGFAVEAE